MNHKTRALIIAAALALAIPAHADIASRAERHVGLREGTATLNRLIKVNTRRVRWCAGFVRAMFDDPPTESLAVKDWKKVGVAVAKPLRGDLAFKRAYSHMGLVIQVKGNKVCVAQGNHKNMVALKCEAASKWKFRRVH